MPIEQKVDGPDPVHPHPVLRRYYSSDEDRPQVVRDLFDAGAPFYERICRIMSFGTGERYRREALCGVGLQRGTRILDLATGTGLMLRSAAEISGPVGLAVGADISVEMLRECGKRCAAPRLNAAAEQLPFADDAFDIVSIGYALRHVGDLRVLFAECARVLKPGGRLLVLEITEPRSRAGRWLTRLYLKTLVPAVAQVTTGAAAARTMMAYFWDTIEACVPPEVILRTMKAVGFADATRRTKGAILSEYVGTKSA